MLAYTINYIMKYVKKWSNTKLKNIVLPHTYIQAEKLWKCFEKKNRKLTTSIS